jgi:UDP-N-acetylmuramoyl-tripeptide--D-alanyl-D-alanine ligase
MPKEGLNFSGVSFHWTQVSPGNLFVWRDQADVPEEKRAHELSRVFRRGAVAAVVQRGSVTDKQYPVLEVDYPLKALQDMALVSSLKFDGGRVLVTGSHGKTAFKTQLYHLIKKWIATHAYLDSGNKIAPVCRSLASIPQGTELVIVEAAVPAKHIGSDRALLIRPNFCVITGIAPEHMISHESMAQLILNKASVVTGLRPGGKCLLNADDEHYAELHAAVRGYSDCEILTYGSGEACDGRLLSAEFRDFHWRVRADILGETVEYDLPLIERYAPAVSVGVLLQAKLLGVDVAASAAEYRSYQNYASSGNFYRVPLGRGCFYVYDQSRRAELKGFESMFELMARLQPEGDGRKILVMSELFDIEANPGVAVDYPKMQALMAGAGISRLYTVKDFKQHQQCLPPGINWCGHAESHEAFQAELLGEIRENDMIFVRGDPPTKLEHLVAALLAKAGATAEKIY